MKSATLDYNFEIQQKCRFEIYNVPDLAQEDNLKTFEFLGSTEVFVGEMVSASGQEQCQRALKIKNNESGQIVFQAEELKNLKQHWYIDA